MPTTTVVCVLYRSTDGTNEWSQNIFDVSWANKLYRGFVRNTTMPFRFICYHDGWDGFDAGIEPRMLLHPEWANMWNLMECFREDLGRVVFMGLDTVVCGSVDDLLQYDGVAAAVCDPYHPELLCSGVMSFPYLPNAWDDFMEHRGDNDTLLDHPSDMPHVRRNIVHSLDDEFPGQFLSYKVHYFEKDHDNARLVYFHGDPKPPNVDAELLEHWV